MLSLPCSILYYFQEVGFDRYASTVCVRQSYFVIHGKQGVEDNMHAFLCGWFFLFVRLVMKFAKQGKNECQLLTLYHTIHVGFPQKAGRIPGSPKCSPTLRSCRDQQLRIWLHLSPSNPFLFTLEDGHPVILCSSKHQRESPRLHRCTERRRSLLGSHPQRRRQCRGMLFRFPLFLYLLIEPLDAGTRKGPL